MNRTGHVNWASWGSLSLMALIVGILASWAWVTEENRQSRLNALPRDVRERMALGEIDSTNELVAARAEIEKLREENTRLQNNVAQNTSASKELNKSLQDLKLFAGLTEVEGGGVTIVLSDSKKPVGEVFDANDLIIHDQDVLSVVNELWNAGAEAISINDKRVGPGTWVRCAGTRILVDSVQVAAPVVIRAIGESKDLYSSMNMPGGWLDQLRQQDPGMVRIEVSQKLNIPAFTGPTSKKHLTETKAKTEKAEAEG